MMPPDARVLASLRSAKVHITLRELAEQAAIAPADLIVRIHELRAAGFDIELRPGYGYRLLGSEDRLVADDLLARLAAGGGLPEFIREIVVFAETGSTNDVAAAMGRQGVEPGVVIFAEKQTAGRGRFGRRWDSASHKGLWFSLLLRPEVDVSDWPRLTTWAAVSTAEALESLARKRTSIKWPNDIFFGDGKTAGMLIELGTDAAQRPFAVVGIGINVNHEPADFPEELQGRATSLRAVSGREMDRAEAAVEVLRALERWYRKVRGEFDEILEEARTRSNLLGRWITVSVGESSLEGQAEAIDSSGRLMLRAANGELITLNAGEVSLHRA